MDATYYIKLFRAGADRHNGILMCLLLLVAETINSGYFDLIYKKVLIIKPRTWSSLTELIFPS